MPRLDEELRIRHANGTFTRWLDSLKNTDVLLLDDWSMAAMDRQTRADLLEIITAPAIAPPSSPVSYPSNIGTSG